MLYQGQLVAQQKKFAIIVSRFNELITQKLLAGAMDAFLRHGAREEEIDIIWVPGAFEIPTTAQWLSEKDYDAIVCLGCVIRGATSHYDLVCNEVAKGIAAVSLQSKKPILFGILTTDSIEQALERAGTKAGNKGFDVAMNAIEMVNLRAQL